jgi:hypothetical protein
MTLGAGISAEINYTVYLYSILPCLTLSFTA